MNLNRLSFEIPEQTLITDEHFKLHDQKESKIYFTDNNGVKKLTHILVDGSLTYEDNNTMNGSGKMVFADGGVYEGNIINNMRFGRGKFTINNGLTYEGDWVRNKCNGYGKLTYGEFWYEGSFVDNAFSGKGCKRSFNGDFYSGEWSENVQHGVGTVYFSNGYRLEALFEGTVVAKNSKLIRKSFVEERILAYLNSSRRFKLISKFGIVFENNAHDIEGLAPMFNCCGLITDESGDRSRGNFSLFIIVCQQQENSIRNLGNFKKDL